MKNLSEAPNFAKQMESLGFPATEISQRKELKPSWIPWRRYTLYRTDFKMGGRKAFIGEKYGPHRIEYFGPVPENGGLAKKDARLVAYEYEENIWTRADNFDHVNFP